MSNRVAMAWLIAALLLGALVAGLVPVHANDVSCGSALSGGTDDARLAQYGADLGNAAAGQRLDAADYQADCNSRLTTQRAFVIPLLIICVLAGGYLLLTARRSGSEGQSPSAV